MLNENNSVPLYVQLYQVLLDQIKSGVWSDGTKLPTESELCEQYSVSRMTVRLALDKLKSQGYLYRKQGKGTYVKIPCIEQPLASFYSFSDSREDGVRKSNVLSFDRMPCEESIASLLQIQVLDPVFVIERVRSIEDTPFAYEFSYIPCTFCPLLNAESISEIGLYKSLLKLAGASPDHARESFRAVKLGKHAAQYLQGHASDPALSIRRIAYLGDQVVEYCDSIVKGDRITYHVEL